MATKYGFGDIDGVLEGQSFESRMALSKAGVHAPTQAGIHGSGKIGAYSIVLSGGYVDDEDHGNTIIYTGHGGNKDKKQIADQSWDSPGNKGLLINEINGIPVRVIRGYTHKSPYSPQAGYRYDGLYYVASHFSEIGIDGFKICRFKLEKIDSFNYSKELDIDYKLPKGSEESKRVATTILRIVRDTRISRSIKELYNYQCQVCSESLTVNGIPYAEAAHVRPLGNPHNGKDEPGNILCLCPNHHVLLDKGGFTIGQDLSLIGIDGSLRVKVIHSLDLTYLAYHSNKIYINQLQ